MNPARRSRNHSGVRRLVRAFGRRLVAVEYGKAYNSSGPLDAALLWRQVAKAAKAVTSHRTPNSCRLCATSNHCSRKNEEDPEWKDIFSAFSVFFRGQTASSRRLVQFLSSWTADRRVLDPGQAAQRAIQEAVRIHGDSGLAHRADKFGPRRLAERRPFGANYGSVRARDRLGKARDQRDASQVGGQRLHRRVEGPHARSGPSELPAKLHGGTAAERVGVWGVHEPEHGDELAGELAEAGLELAESPAAMEVVALLYGRDKLQGLVMRSAELSEGHDVAGQRAPGEGAARGQVRPRPDARLGPEAGGDFLGVRADMFAQPGDFVDESDAHGQERVERVLHHLGGLGPHEQHLRRERLEELFEQRFLCVCAHADDDALRILESVERPAQPQVLRRAGEMEPDRKSTRLNSSHR